MPKKTPSKNGRTRSQVKVPNPGPFLAVGLVLALLGVIVLAWLYFLGLGGSSLEKLVPSLKKDFNYMAAPAVIFLFAGVPLFFAVMFLSAGKWSKRDRGFFRGGSTRLVLPSGGLTGMLLWMLVPAAAWVVLVPVPLQMEAEGTAFQLTGYGVYDDFWTLVSIYGFFAAGTVGVFLASLLKRATYTRLAIAFGPAKRGRTFWTLVSAQWRGETWFAFASTGLFGWLPFLWHEALYGRKAFDDSALTIIVSIAVVCGVLAVVIVLNAWRCGEEYGFAESVA